MGGMAWDGMGWVGRNEVDGMGWSGVGWDGVEWSGVGSGGMGWGGVWWGGIGLDGMGWSGKGWGGTDREHDRGEDQHKDVIERSTLQRDGVLKHRPTFARCAVVRIYSLTCSDALDPIPATLGNDPGSGPALWGSGTGLLPKCRSEEKCAGVDFSDNTRCKWNPTSFPARWASNRILDHP